MNEIRHHTFHIPVMGLGFSIDTPLKVARFGISAALSIVDDQLLEEMRKFYMETYGHPYRPIPPKSEDSRARRITAYLNLLQELVGEQLIRLRQEVFTPDSDITRYFELLPDTSPLKKEYHEMGVATGSEREAYGERLRHHITAGDIDVNIMTKVDKTNYDRDGRPLPPEYSDALAALRGFALSNLRSSVILSAGLNPRLYAYFEAFDDFFPDADGALAKRIILKVSDYRSALIQGKFLAKKGLWISEFRIESGLNCGGHAFINDGILLGPILESFKTNRQALYDELKALCDEALVRKQRHGLCQFPLQRITVQGGIGTAAEDRFLLDYYRLDGTGWGSPFLLVPEATRVDADTLRKLTEAGPEDFYLSNASPLGVPFHNFRNSSSEAQRKLRIEKGRPGSPCHKKFLSFNSEFTEVPICTASRQYQYLKLQETKAEFADEESYQNAVAAVLEKDCLCEGLAAPALLANGITPKRNLQAVTICPGPNLAYFSGILSLEEMVGHIYGKISVLNNVFRPNLFVNELNLYVAYLRKELEKYKMTITAKQRGYFQTFRENLLAGIEYYRSLIPLVEQRTQLQVEHMKSAFATIEKALQEMAIPVPDKSPLDQLAG